MKAKTFTFLTIFISLFGYSQQTFVPDDNFEQALIDLGHDTVLDDNVTTANINGVTSLNVASKSISDLTGIEDFVALTTLICTDNQLTNLDLSQNTDLNSLNCSFNQLNSLNISSNVMLTVFDCRMNQLSALDVSSLTNLLSLKCSGNPINTLDVTQNAVMSQLECAGNQLSSLNLTQNSMLSYLLCSGNLFTDLNVSQNPLLASLNTNNCTSLASLDLTQNLALTDLSCVNNPLTDLDLSQCTALTYLNCNANQLTSLNVKNGNNTNVTYFFAANNPSLTCIEVDDEAYSNTNWINIDSQTSFSEDCSNLAVLDYELETVSIYPNPTHNIVNVKTVNVIESIELYSVLGKQLLVSQSQNHMDVSRFQAGIYFIKIRTEKGQVTKKIVIK